MTQAHDPQNLYGVSELAQVIIRNRADAQHWSLTTFPGKIRLPKDIFHNLENREAALNESRKEYLSAETLTWVKSLGRKTNGIAGPSVSRARFGGLIGIDGV